MARWGSSLDRMELPDGLTEEQAERVLNDLIAVGHVVRQVTGRELPFEGQVRIANGGTPVFLVGDLAYRTLPDAAVLEARADGSAFTEYRVYRHGETVHHDLRHARLRGPALHQIRALIPDPIGPELS